MIQIFRKTAKDQTVKELEKFMSGSWLYAENPNEEELSFLENEFGLDPDLLQDGLDPNEVPRLEFLEKNLYVYTRFPYRSGEKVVTVPMLLVIGKNFVVTISEKGLPFLERVLKFKNHFSTVQPMQFFLYLLAEADESYGTSIMRISRSVRSLRIQIEDINNKDIIKFVNFEETLNDLIAALVPISTILQKLLYRMKFSESQKDEIEDLILRNGELTEVCKTNLRTIVNIREGYSTIMTNNLNRIIRVLTALTIVLTIPTIVGSIYGMNVALPYANSPHAFWWVLGATCVISLLTLGIFWRNKWL